MSITPLHDQVPRQIAALAMVLVLAMIADSGSAAPPAPAADAADTPRPYMRVSGPDARTRELQIAIRRLQPREKEGPTIWLTAVVHIGSKRYYQSLQDHLDAQDLVLYEGVGSPAFLDPRPGSDRVRADRTRTALDFIALMATWYHQQHGSFPVSLSILSQAADAGRPRHSWWLKRALRDGWSHPIDYKRKPDGFVLTSFGADGRPGGQDLAADIVFDEPPPTEAARKLSEPILQSSLAEALGLVFQLDVIDYDRRHFINSDMPLGRIRLFMREQPGGQSNGDPDLDQLIRLMDGSSMLASVLKGGFRVLGSSPQLRAMMKLFMVEMLGEIKGDMAQMRGMPPAFRRLMRILIEDRNRIVLRDLKQHLQRPDPPQSISVFYGAGHMADLEKRIVRELDYRPAGDRWYSAFGADVRQAGLTEGDLKLVRALIRAQMRQLQGGPVAP